MVLFRRYEGHRDALRAAARSGLRAIPFFVLGAAIVWFIVDSEFLQACVNKPSRAQAYKALHENLTVLHLSVRIYRHCLFGLANKVANGITALATVVVASFTVTLWQVGRDQHAAAMGALKLARDEFDSIHRPRLIIRQIQYETVSVGNYIKFRYMVVNVGDTDAIIAERNQTIVYSRAIEITGALTNVPDTVNRQEFIIQPGAFQWFDFGEEILSDSQFQRIQVNVEFITIYGYVAYKDRANTIRRTGFFREYANSARRFFPIHDHEYEYVD